MTIRREHVGALLAAAALVAAAGCGGSGGGSAGGSGGATAGDASGNEPAGDSGGDATVDDGGMSIQDVTTLTLEGDLNVRGWVVDVDGATRLCSSADGSPPSCGTPSLELVGYEGEVPSPEEVTLTGEVLGSTLTIG